MNRWLGNPSWGWIPFVAALTVFTTPMVEAQTFAHVVDIDGGVGPRLTMNDVQGALGHQLLASLRGAAGIANFGGSGVAYLFVADPMAGRVLFAKEGDWIREFTGAGLASGPLRHPEDVDFAAGGVVYVADPILNLVRVLDFDGNQLTLLSETDGQLTNPVSVAWDGKSAPFDSVSFYALEARGPVSYWYPQLGQWYRAWSYGSHGSGIGEFDSPMAVCVGRTGSSVSGGSVFTANFYVVDSGNQRVVWLQRTSNGANWLRERALPEGWKPVDCTIDHFGNVYIADEQNSQLVKYNYALDELARYGSYGTGETNPNTFANPVALSVPFGVSGGGGQGTWYGEGTIFTGETWVSASGILKHWLGVEVDAALAWSGTFAATTDFHLTDHGTVDVSVFNSSGTHIATVISHQFYPPSWHSGYWSGLKDDGTPAPAGDYYFRVEITSAYGCSGQPWCFDARNTSTFYWSGDTCEDPELGRCNPPMENVALTLDGEVTLQTLPSAFRLGQAITPYAGPLFRVQGNASASVSALMTDAQAVASVRANGIRALHVDVPRGEPAHVTIRIYSLSGRLVRVLTDETLDPGSYLVGWDGADEQGRAVLPGVYLAHMHAGSYRGIQRLIIR